MTIGLAGSVKRVARDAYESIAGPPAAARRKRKSSPGLVVLAYHRVAPADDPAWACEQPGMLVTPGTLAMHCRVLREHFTPVHLDEWFERRTAGDPLPQLSCALTFDDGWRDNFEHAFPVLRAAGMPATVFLVSDLIGSAASFWPNRLMRALLRLDRGEGVQAWPEPLRDVLLPVVGNVPWPPSPAVLDAAVYACWPLEEEAVESGLARVGANLGVGRDLLDWDEAREMASSGLVRFGSHTRRHLRLGRPITTEQLEDEVAGSRAVIEAQLGRPVNSFCYPFGSVSAVAAERVRAHYRLAVINETGWNGSDCDPWTLRRIRLHNDISRRRPALLARLAQLP